MITEDYVSFDVAKLLKEKGFNEICEMFYCKPHEGYLRNRKRNEGWNSDLREDMTCTCPTLQMAMKWLREKHNIHIEIGYNMGYFPVCISTKTNDTIPYIAMGSPFTYEKACEVAIKYCLENLI